MKRLIAAGLLACLAWTVQAEAQPRKRDLDGDGRAEALVFYEKNVPIKAVADRDNDGYVEAVFHYKGGRRDYAEIDLDRDGRTDQWVTYVLSGEAWKSGYDFDHDGRADYWTYTRNGKVYKWEQDRNGDGRPDLRTYYEAPNDRIVEQPLFRQTYDNDFDGDFETFSGLSTRKPEPRIPHSLAEALITR
jgi:hypothetical protein